MKSFAQNHQRALFYLPIVVTHFPMHLIQKNHSLCEDLPCKGNSNEWKRCRGLLVFILTHWKCYLNNCLSGTSLVVQWLRLHSFKAGGLGSIPGRGTKIPHAVRHCQTPPPPATKKNPAFLNSQKVSSLLHIIPTPWVHLKGPLQLLQGFAHSHSLCSCFQLVLLLARTRSWLFL